MTNYILDTFQENVTKIDNLYELLENVMIDLEYYSLTESETLLLGSPEKKTASQKAGNIAKTLWNNLKALWEKIKNVLGELVKKAIGSNIYYVAKTDIVVGPYTFDKFPDSICSKILTITNNTDSDIADGLEDKIDQCITETMNNKYTIPEGNKIDVVALLKHRKANDKYIKALEAKLKSTNPESNTFRVYRKLMKFLSLVGRDTSAIISNAKLFKKPTKVEMYDKDGNKIDSKDSRVISKYNKADRDYNRVHGIKNESVSRNEFIADILLEAADLLKNDEI